MRIFDDDIDVTALVPENVANTLDEDIGDDNPTVADVVDERPEHVKQLEKYRQDSRWKLMSSGAVFLFKILCVYYLMGYFHSNRDL